MCNGAMGILCEKPRRSVILSFADRLICLFAAQGVARPPVAEGQSKLQQVTGCPTTNQSRGH